MHIQAGMRAGCTPPPAQTHSTTSRAQGEWGALYSALTPDDLAMLRAATGQEQPWPPTEENGGSTIAAFSLATLRVQQKNGVASQDTIQAMVYQSRAERMQGLKPTFDDRFISAAAHYYASQGKPTPAGQMFLDNNPTRNIWA